jgi:prephenate dehydrogenase
VSELSMAATLEGKTLCILGLGLMGGSLARAIRSEVPGARIVGWNRSEGSRLQALESGVFDVVSADVSEVLCEADLVVLCVPVLVAVELMASHAGLIAGRGVVVTDVGSTKADVCSELELMLSAVGCEFVGSHPICGGEQSGFDASSAALYHDALVIVTPGVHVTRVATRQVTGLWRVVGSRVLEMEPAAHDRVLARTSHLPHVAAAALVHAVAREPACQVGMSGSGFVDSTRVASGPESVWHDILKSNASAVADEVRALSAELTSVASWLERGEFDALRDWLGEARQARGEVLAARTRLFDELNGGEEAERT